MMMMVMMLIVMMMMIMFKVGRWKESDVKCVTQVVRVTMTSSKKIPV